MTGNAWVWIGAFCLIWLGLGYYFLFYRKNPRLSLIPGVIIPKDDSEVIVSKTKIMINVIVNENERELATPAVLADFVISFKDIVSGSYKPNLNTVIDQDLTSAGPKKQQDQSLPNGPGENEEDTPDLSDQPDIPEVDANEAPEKEDDSKLTYEESQLVDSNTLNLNMSNL